MAKITIAEFAKNIGVPTDRLTQQLMEAGMGEKSANGMITDEEKSDLLNFLRRRHSKKDGFEPEKIILKRKTISEIKMPPTTQSRIKSRTKTVNVEFRKRRTYVKRSVVAKDMLKQREDEVAAQQAKQQEAEEQKLKIQAEKVAQQAEEATPQADALNNEKATLISEPPITAEENEVNAASMDTIPQATPAVDEPETPKKQAEQKDHNSRKELHIASEKSGRRRKRTIRPKSVVAQASRKHGFEKPTAPIVHAVEIPESITVADLAQRMSIKASEVLKTMMGLGSIATINQTIDQDVAAIVVEEMGHKPQMLKENALEEKIIQSSKQAGAQISRTPIVTIMGHVDHGKTSLLDYIRRSKVAAGEPGGITQHIGAYRVSTDNGDITFLDTPGHEAFTAMRARGAKVTDVVVVVIAADDGVMPQTDEAIKHAKAGSVPIIVAINKIDKDDADTERVKRELSKHGLISEDLGGDTMVIHVSAKTGQGIDELLDGILLQTEILELKAIKSGPASGTVIESRLDKGRGPVASILVQNGKLNKGDVILSGHEFGRVRSMIDHSGREVSEVGPSTPVEVFGLSGTPRAGDEMIVVPDEKKAREIALFRQGKYRETKMVRQQTAKLEDVLSQMGDGLATGLNLIIKTDVQGSAEAMVDMLTRLSNDEVQVNIVSSGVGGITESDINLAMTSKGRVIGFNVRADAAAKKLADAEGIDLRYYSVIYDVVDDVKAIITGLLTPEVHEQIIGIAEVRDVFHSPKFGNIAGCMVASGAIKRNSPIRVLRDNIVIYQGELESLRRFKNDVSEVKSGMECGIGVKNYTDVRVGDQIEIFECVEVERNA